MEPVKMNVLHTQYSIVKSIAKDTFNWELIESDTNSSWDIC